MCFKLCENGVFGSVYCFDNNPFIWEKQIAFFLLWLECYPVCFGVWFGELVYNSFSLNSYSSSHSGALNRFSKTVKHLSQAYTSPQPPATAHHSGWWRYEWGRTLATYRTADVGFNLIPMCLCIPTGVLILLKNLRGDNLSLLCLFLYQSGQCPERGIVRC